MKVDKTVKGEFTEIQNESAVRAEFIPVSEKEFIVKCKIIENNVKIFEIETLASSREQAVKIVQNWEENVGEIYPKVIQLLNTDNNEPKEQQFEDNQTINILNDAFNMQS